MCLKMENIFEKMGRTKCQPEKKHAVLFCRRKNKHVVLQLVPVPPPFSGFPWALSEAGVPSTLPPPLSLLTFSKRSAALTPAASSSRFISRARIWRMASRTWLAVGDMAVVGSSWFVSFVSSFLGQHEEGKTREANSLGNHFSCKNKRLSRFEDTGRSQRENPWRLKTETRRGFKIETSRQDSVLNRDPKQTGAVPGKPRVRAFGGSLCAFAR